MAQGWIDRFPALDGLSADLKQVLAARSAVVRAPRGTRIFGPGQAPDHLLLSLSGTVRVQQTSESGREIVLYRVDAGQSCVLTTACLLAQQDYMAEGIAETDVEAVAIPRATFDDLVSRSHAFRSFVFEAYGKRIADLFRIIDDVAFGHVDVRLADRLLVLAGAGDTLRVTHQQLAAELGTAREVVSRQLTEFQKRGWITQARGCITLADRSALSRLAAS
jgi:CRP/FNR family transcriptional regulator